MHTFSHLPEHVHKQEDGERHRPQVLIFVSEIKAVDVVVKFLRSGPAQKVLGEPEVGALHGKLRQAEREVREDCISGILAYILTSRGLRFYDSYLEDDV